jgi:hypothetical protein
MPSLISLLCGVLSPFHLVLWELLDDLHERFAGAAGDSGSCVWFRDSGNLSSAVVVNPARFGDCVMHVRFDIGSLLVFCRKQT